MSFRCSVVGLPTSVLKVMDSIPPGIVRLLGLLTAQLRSVASLIKIMVRKTDTITDLMLEDLQQLLEMFRRNKILSGTFLCQTLF